MKKIGKNRRITIIIPIICIIVIIGIIIGANVIKVNIANGKYNSSNSGSNNKNLIPEYIKEGITLGGITGTLKVLDTSDATAKPEDITKGKTAYVNGVKITGTKITREILKIGDYVEYTPDTASAYSLTTAVSGYTSNQSIPQETLEWQILNVNEDGTVDLISSSTTNQKISLLGALGYNNGVWLLNDICEKQYSNKELGVTARSINIEDVEGKYSQIGKNARDEYINGNVKYGNTQTYTGGYTYYPNLFSKEIGAGVNNTNVNKNGIGPSDSYYASPTNETYSKANSITMTNTHYGLTYYSIETEENYFNDPRIYNLFINLQENYWIASRFTRPDPAYGYYGIKIKVGNNISGANLFDSALSSNVDAFPDTRSNCLRPIVTLNSNIKFIDGDGSESNPYKISK